jgi:hypothetical protein
MVHEAWEVAMGFGYWGLGTLDTAGTTEVGCRVEGRRGVWREKQVEMVGDR